MDICISVKNIVGDAPLFDGKKIQTSIIDIFNRFVYEDFNKIDKYEQNLYSEAKWRNIDNYQVKTKKGGPKLMHILSLQAEAKKWLFFILSTVAYDVQRKHEANMREDNLKKLLADSKSNSIVDYIVKVADVSQHIKLSIELRDVIVNALKSKMSYAIAVELADVMSIFLQLLMHKITAYIWYKHASITKSLMKSYMLELAIASDMVDEYMMDMTIYDDCTANVEKPVEDKPLILQGYVRDGDSK